MPTLLHTGDTHVGYQQYHSPERRHDFLRAFQQVIDDAIEFDVDAVVHAGDLFQDRRPDLPDLQGVISALTRLREAEIPFLAIVGNHEEKRDRQWLDLLADLGLAERLDNTPRFVDRVAIYGLDYVPPAMRDQQSYKFDPADAEAQLLVAHGLFEPFTGADWDTETVLSESSISFDALLLGDNHEPGTKRVDGTWLTYPGSTERASASEREPRGYNLITIDEEIRISRRTIDTRKFVFVDIELSPGEGQQRVRERVREFEHHDAVTIVTIEGEGEPVTPGPIEELAYEQGALIARVNDRRKIEDPDEELDVHFADPDAAVRDQLSESDLSPAGRTIDQTIRNLNIADSNVRETVSRRLEEHIADGIDSLTTETTTKGDEQDTKEPAVQQQSMEDYL